MTTSLYLADLGEARGKQELFTRQAPQRLKRLKESALIESAVSSNRIEGVTVDPPRVATLVFGRSHPRDRDEQEVRGYRDALNLVHQEGARLPMMEETVLRLHALCRAGMGDAGRYKEVDSDIIEKYANGRQRVRFKTAPAGVLPARIRGGRYISLERLIEQNKDRYYETLEQSSQSWHEGTHDPWPYINYLLYILKAAYLEFEDRVGRTASPRGAKTESILAAINGFSGDFTLGKLERACPGVSRDMIRRVLRDLRRADKVRCRGRGPGAVWRRGGNTLSKGS